MNPFQALPAKVRATLYIVYGFVALGTTSVAAYYGAINQDGTMPDWIIGLGAALVPVGAALQFTAAANVNTTNQAVIDAPATVEFTEVPDDSEDPWEYEGRHIADDEDDEDAVEDENLGVPMHEG